MFLASPGLDQKGEGLSEEVEVSDLKETICYREAGPKDGKGKGLRSNQGCLRAVLTEGIQILVTPISHIGSAAPFCAVGEASSQLSAQQDSHSPRWQN